MCGRKIRGKTIVRVKEILKSKFVGVTKMFAQNL